MTQGNRIRREPGDRDPVLARIGHELRTPLNSIIGFTGTLLMGMPGPLNEDQDRQLRTVQSSARRLLALVNDLLDLMKIDAGERELVREPVDCVAVMREVEEIVRPEAEQRGSRLSLTRMEGSAIIDTDRRALRQILVGLVAAAIRHGDRSLVEIGVGRLESQEGTVIDFHIDQDGAGIGAVDPARFFEPFTRFEPPATQAGSGLELYLCRKLAALLGGRIAIESGPKGTRLLLQLPA